MADLALTHVTTPTQFVEKNGIRFAYRRFGRPAGIPLVLMTHYRAGMDHWDPAVTDGLAAGRTIILFDNAGVSGSSGETPDTIEAMADCAADFVDALGFPKVDVLGFSIGGYIAQELARQRPALVRRLLLADTGPRGGEASNDPHYLEYGASTDPQTGETGFEAFMYLLFAPSAKSQAAGKAFWQRRHLRKNDVDPPSSAQTMAAQRAAITAWRQLGEKDHPDLRAITQPVLVVSGCHDIMIPTINAYTLSQYIPDAQLIIYPDSGHGAMFQYPDLFVKHAELFLDDIPA
jgi:pimeloyl-ACP methyl ester carboxylesterase